MTALFCDLAGFTPLSEQLDPEEVRDIQAAYFEQMRQQIERYGGTVEKYAGDAILALFGAPIAHEDDAERAVLCALGMQAAIEPVAELARDRWNVEPAIRVGVNTGEVVSGVWEAGGRQDVSVTGDSINTAARIQAAGEPGEVLVGAETMRLTRRRIRYGDKRELTLKGKMGAVPAYVALGLREELGERWEEGPRVSPLIGREREMVQLLDAWMRTQGGEGQLVTVVGDPGVGKSRLVAELLNKVSSGAAVRIIRARSLSYGQEISFWLLADLLRALFVIKEQDSLEEVKSKLLPAISTMLVKSDDSSQMEALDVVGEVLGLPPGDSVVGKAGAQIRRQALIRSLRLLLGGLSERATAMVVLEDLHWIDQASEEVLREIVSDIPGLRILMVVTQRPGWTPPWSDWGWTERLTLRPLGEQDATLLAGAVLGGVNLSPDLERYVAERAGGNPFFVEEMLRALDETGGLEQRDGQVFLAPGAAERLPSTLTEVLLARLDRLDGQVRNVAQVASVIGRSFAVRLLSQVIGREQAALQMPLTALQEAEIAFPRQASEPEYVFKHVSMREVAYNTLVQKRRQELHLQAARSIAALYSSDEYVEMIAYHYSKTAESEEAVEWLERAGDRAAAIYATESAISHYKEASERLHKSDAEPIAVATVNEKLGSVLYSAGRYDESLEVLGRAAHIYQEARELEKAGRATAQMGMAHRYRGTPEDGVKLVEPMIEQLQSMGPSAALASLRVALSSLFSFIGQYQDMVLVAEQAAEIARAIGDDRLLGEAEERRGTALLALGQTLEARRVLESAVPRIEAGGDLVVLWRALNNAGEACKQIGELEQCKDYTVRSLEICQRIGNSDQIGFVMANVGNILTLQGDWQGAREHLERALLLAGAGGRSASVANPLTYLGQLNLWQGKCQEASRLLSEALAMTEETGDLGGEEETRLLMAELELMEENPDAALANLEPLARQENAELIVFPVLAWAYLEQGDSTSVTRSDEIITIATRRGREMQKGLYVLDALRIQGMVKARQERWEEAEHAFNEGLGTARSAPFPYAEGRILFELGKMYSQRDDEMRARENLQQALTIFQRLGAMKDIEGTQEMLAKLEG